MSYDWSRPIVAHTGSYLFLKMEASRVPCTRSGTNSRYGDTVASVHGDSVAHICIACASLVLIRTQPLDSGQELIFANLSEVGIEPVTSMIKNR